MKVKNMPEYITFDDVLLRPRYSRISSRSEISTSVEMLTKEISLKFSNPIIPANMKHITGVEMCEFSYKNKSMALMHRFDDVLLKKKDFVNKFKSFGSDWYKFIGFSIGIHDDDLTHAKELFDLGVRIICIDVAHAHNKHVGDFVTKVKSISSELFVIAGNVATAEGYSFLAKAGADAVKVNVGAGSICTTRVQTGAGVPQLSALQEIYDVKKFKIDYPYIIADGGMSQPGHMVIALGYSDMLMTGNLVAGSDECPGAVTDGYKDYNGSSTHKTKHVEGVKAKVRAKGPMSGVLDHLLDGIKSGCSYQGVSCIQELKQSVPESIIRISNSSFKESHHHDVLV